jgi:hypothetical protein
MACTVVVDHDPSVDNKSTKSTKVLNYKQQKLNHKITIKTEQINAKFTLRK